MLSEKVALSSGETRRKTTVEKIERGEGVGSGGVEDDGGIGKGSEKENR